MLTKYIKERLSRPILSEVTENQPPSVTKISVLERLKTYKPGELFLEEEDDDDSDSDNNDTLDPFQDLKNRASMDKLFKKTKKRLTKLENNMHLMSSFSEDFKIAMDEAKAELEIKASDTFYEDMNKINETLREARLWKDLPKSMEEKLDDIFEYTDFNCGPDLDIHTPRKSSISDENEENEKEAQDKKENKEDKEKEINGELNTTNSSYESEFDVMSGIWNMFNTSEDLVCTTPNYDAYRQQSPHWLDRESVPWEEFDKARLKCVNWMQNNEEKV